MTHIALLDSYPNHSATAELEFIKRFSIVAKRLGVKITVARTSDELIAASPDFVLATHQNTPKLTDFTTIGVMWSPPIYYQTDPFVRKSVRSYDGYLVSSQATIDALKLEMGDVFSAKLLSSFPFYPTSPSRIADAQEFSRLAYIGSNWDGHRHGDLLKKLAELGELRTYGPESNWRHLPAAYCGAPPFDGTSVISTLAEHGVALCLHLEHHRLADTPSMRIFEACSAGCVLICDDIPFAKREFGDAAIIIPGSFSVDEKAEFINERMNFLRANPRRARAMADECRQIFERKYSLDVMFPKVIEFAEKVQLALGSRGLSRSGKENFERIDVVVFAERANSRQLRRAIYSICEQIWPVHIIIVGAQSAIDEISLLIEQSNKTFTILPHLDPTWEGIQSVISAGYFACIDATITWGPMHLESLHCALSKMPDRRVAISGFSEVRENGTYVQRRNFDGDRKEVIKERREVLSVAPFGFEETESAAWDFFVEACLMRAGSSPFPSMQKIFGQSNLTVSGADSVNTGRVTAFRHLDIEKAITITGYRRPHLFRGLLRSLCKNDLNGWHIFVQLEPTEFSSEYEDIAGELLENYSYSVEINPTRLGVAQNPFSLVNHAFDSGANLVLYLEEDLHVAEDITKLSEWYCANHRAEYICLSLMCGGCGSAGFISDKQYSSDLFAGKIFNSLGFAVRREEWYNHFKPFWLREPDHFYDFTGRRVGGWDWSVYQNLLHSKDLFSLLPVAARATHTGRDGGVHCPPEWHDLVFAGLDLAAATSAGLDYCVVAIDDLPPAVRRQAVFWTEAVAGLKTIRERSIKIEALEEENNRLLALLSENNDERDELIQSLRLKQRQLDDLTGQKPIRASVAGGDNA